ncbi:MAG: methylmalonyl Co-A mutase-associated GTPase MeaB, partial [gamma proteobacterium symbiont of Phacoides pectinatus]
MDLEALAGGVLGGQRRALSRAITLVESSRADHRDLAARLLQRLAPHAGGAMRIGVTGVPGAGAGAGAGGRGPGAGGRG